MSAANAFGKHFGMLLAFAAGTTVIMFLLMFILVLPFFQQLFGEIVYITPDNIWVFGLIAILFTFGLGFAMNYWYANKIGGTQYRGY